MYNFGSFDAFIVRPTILPEICSTKVIEALNSLINLNNLGLLYDLRQSKQFQLVCNPMYVKKLGPFLSDFIFFKSKWLGLV